MMTKGGRASQKASSKPHSPCQGDRALHGRPRKRASKLSTLRNQWSGLRFRTDREENLGRNKRLEPEDLSDDLKKHRRQEMRRTWLKFIEVGAFAALLLLGCIGAAAQTGSGQSSQSGQSSPPTP